MAYDRQRLTETLVEMKRIYLADPNLAVRSQNFIKQLHQYCIEELIARGFTNNLAPRGEIKVLTSHKFKDTDVAVIHPTSGPLIVIGVRSQMSSIGKNFINYFEMEVGDVFGLHERYPLCVVGLLYLHPANELLPNKPTGAFDFHQAERMFSQITDREKGSDPWGHYENIAYMRVNFDQDPPILDDAFPTFTNLKLDDFFDKLVQKYKERNFPLY